MRKINLLISIAVATLGFNSCGLYTDFSTPESEVENLAGETIALPDTAAVAVPGWKEYFTDAHLQALINEALVSNSDIRISALNVEQAERALRVSRRAFIPSFTLGPNGSVSGVPNAGTGASYTYAVPVQASWELDIFGRLRNAKEQAKAGLMMTNEYDQLIRTQIISGIANAYYSLVLLDNQLSMSREAEKLATESYEAIKSLKEVGLQSEAAVLSASANLSKISLSIKDIEVSIADTEGAICLLLNKAPMPIVRGNILDLKCELGAAVSLVVLSNRPDVKAAEMNLAQSFYGVNYARAALYPNIRISGAASWTNNLGGVIVNPADFLFSALASITQPIFQAGANKANLENAKDKYEQQLISFEKALLVAGSDVNTYLGHIKAAEDKVELSAEQVKQLSNAVDVTKDLMLFGKANYLEVIAAQSAYLEAQIAEATNLYNYCVGGINLFKALGGE